MFKESCELDEKTFKAATRFIENLTGLGGTNLFTPLRNLFNQKPKANFRFEIEINFELISSRNLIILTDGIVQDPSRVLSLIREHISDTKVFSFGIGSDVDKDFIQALAKDSGGRSEFIGDRNSLEKQATHYIAKALLPSITDIRIDWKGYKPRYILEEEFV